MVGDLLVVVNNVGLFLDFKIIYRVKRYFLNSCYVFIENWM